jgi:hypothetical protein
MPTSGAPLGMQLVQALGTFSAAVVALYIALRAESRESRRQPRLRLLFDADTDDFEVAVGSPTPTHWIRLRVSNQTGRRSAEDVEVIIVDVLPRREASLSGFTLLWSNLPESLPSGPPVLASRQTIPPGVARHVDILCMPAPSPERAEDPPCSLWIQAQPAREDSRHEVLEGTTHVLLAVAARDTDAVYYDVTIEFDGSWVPDDEIKHRLRLSVEPGRVASQRKRNRPLRLRPSRVRR